MRSTKSEILALLKRTDGCTVDELASSLALAPMTIRQHLVALQRDALVDAREVRRPTGRPHYRYVLTDDGHRRVADGYDRLLQVLVEEAGHLEPADLEGSPVARRARLFERAAASLGARHRATISLRPPQEAVEVAAQTLRSYGAFPETAVTEHGIELRDYSCPYRSMVTREGPCVWHEAFLLHLLGVEIRTAAPAAGCADCCRYIIPVALDAAAGRGNSHGPD